MDYRSIGLLIIALGGGAVLIGLIVTAGGFSWFGRLPGDLRFDGGNTHVFVPLTSLVLVSVVLTVILNLLTRWR